MAEAFEMSSGVSETGAPLVLIRWGSMIGHLTPSQAREHAQAMIAVAETATVEACVMGWAQERFGLTMQEAAVTLAELRTHLDGLEAT